MSKDVYVCQCEWNYDLEKTKIEAKSPNHKRTEILYNLVWIKF